MDFNQLFEDISIDHIREFADNYFETRHIEFKTATTNGRKLDSNDKDNFFKHVSGFANASGGLIVWGVVADEKNEANIDMGHDLKPVENVDGFVNLLNKLNPLDPPLDIITKRIGEPDNHGAGFAVTLIPQSDFTPHQAADLKYYLRIGDKSFPMHHSQLEDMFGRRPRPKLELALGDKDRWVQSSTRENDRRGRQSEVKSIHLPFLLRNIGRGTAKDIFITFDWFDHPVDKNNAFSLVTMTSAKHAYRADISLHPNMELNVFKAQFTRSRLSKAIPEIGMGPGGYKDSFLPFMVAAENFPLQEIRLKIPERELRMIGEDLL